MGDFNEVRSEHERFGSVFNVQGANVFNNFIFMSNLIDLPLEGYGFTWAYKTVNKMSKLDRFLISRGLLSLFPSLSALCLDRHLSDHRPIFMRELNIDYGPTPFRIFHSWFDIEGFDKLVEDTWLNTIIEDLNGMLKFKKKLQVLKSAIKQWSRNAKSNSFKAKIIIQTKLADLDNILDQGGSNEDILNTRSTLLKELHEINFVDSSEKAQKAKIRWAIEGTENSKYFHGDWIVDSNLVKNEFFSHFSNRFSKPDPFRICLVDQYTNRLSSEQKEDVERNVTLNENKIAIWDCGTNKTLGPDGFTFEFFRRYWKFLDKDIMAAVSDFFSLGEFSSGCNYSFIALIPKLHDAKVVSEFRPISLIRSLYKIITKILANRLTLVISDLISDIQSAFVTSRQILDGPFILNELLSWCKHKKLKVMFFKVDFEKAFDSIRWDYLDDVLMMFGFGNKWRCWIRRCLKSARG
ncbi:RNA-directed DNA polymerase, eukaryota, partial [Tanacetum coccineum]